MKKNRLLLLAFFFTTSILVAQRQTLKGQLVAKGDVEGLHILNKTAVKYIVSNEKGSFTIPAKAKDTLVISGLKYKNKTLIITQNMVTQGRFKVALEEKINQLQEVVVGTIFTGSLESDIENSDAKPDVNFYDLGIPGYTGKPLTQNERKLHDAESGGPIYTGLGVNFHKLLNRISGRTKKLKTIVALDDKQKCLEKIRSQYESAIFENDTLSANLKNEYFYFCDEDPKFTILCKQQNDLAMIDFLKLKLKAYKQNLKEKAKE